MLAIQSYLTLIAFAIGVFMGKTRSVSTWYSVFLLNRQLLIVPKPMFVPCTEKMYGRMYLEQTVIDKFLLVLTLFCDNK
ncbi:MAG: hypothetical protein C4330_03980 [Chitinophagaceae bacterium]